MRAGLVRHSSGSLSRKTLLMSRTVKNSFDLVIVNLANVLLAIEGVDGSTLIRHEGSSIIIMVVV